jgi:hypothetical protein
MTAITPRPVASLRPRLPPMLIGLPVTIAGTGVADGHAVGVHDPGHDLGIRPHIGRGNIGVRADQGDQFSGITAGETFEFALTERARVNDDPALRAAEGDVGKRTFPGHPHGKGADFIEIDGGAVAQAAFGRAENRAVMDTVAREHFDTAIVALDGEVNGEFAAGIT